MYKSQLQEYAQKAGLLPPTYEHIKEGASHEPRFKSTVFVDGQSYSSAPGYPTLRSAEHAAAKVALDYLQKTQTSGVVPSPVHESGLCKNLLQEFAQKNGYPLPQYKIMRQGEEHSLTFTATVEIAGVSYSGGGAKSKKEAEIKAARTALLAIQATQPAAAWGLPAVEPYRPPPSLPQPGPIASFVKSHSKRKKRGRTNQQVIEEPLATRIKLSGGQSTGMMQITQMPHVQHLSQVHQMPHVLVTQVPQVLQKVPMEYVAQATPLNPMVRPGQNVTPLPAMKQELGVSTRTAFIVNEPVQVTDSVPDGKPQILDLNLPKPLATVHGTVEEIKPTLITEVSNIGDQVTTGLVTTEQALPQVHEPIEKVESVTIQQVPLGVDAMKESQELSVVPTQGGSIYGQGPETSVTAEVKETVPAKEIHVPSVSTSAVIPQEAQYCKEGKEHTSTYRVDLNSVPIPAITPKLSGQDTLPNLVDAPNIIPSADGELQIEILNAMNAGLTSVSSGAA